MPEQRSAPVDLDLFRMVVENLPQSAVYVFDHDLRYLLAEGEALRAAGLGDLVGRRLSDVASGDSLATLERHYRGALAGVEADFEHPGEDLLRWYRVRVRPVRDSSGAVIGGMVVTDDVTEARLDREEVRSSHAFQNAVLTTAPNIVSVYDVDAEQTLWASRSLDEMLGRGLEAIQELQSEGIATVLHPDDVTAFQADMAAVRHAQDGEIIEGTARVVHADGSWRVLARRSTPFMRSDDGKVIHALNVSWDITELQDVRAFQDAVITATPDLIVLLDAAEQRISWSSRPLEELFGALPEGPLEGAVFAEALHPDDKAEYWERRIAACKSADGTVVQVRFRVRHRDGSWVWLLQRMTPFTREENGRVRQLLLLVRDITDVVQAELDLEHAALHDQLTGLPNRRLVADRLRMALASREHGGQVAALFLDLDGFKKVNDLHGHAAGDLVLEETARRLLATVRQGDTVGRMGGDEFIVLVTALAGESLAELANTVGERLRRAIARPISPASYRVTASIGIALTSDAEDADAVLRQADTAMYAAKTAGKDQLATYQP